MTVRLSGRPGILLAALISLWTGACAPAPPVTAIGGALDVLGPDQTFINEASSGGVPAGWVLDGQPGPAALGIETIDGLPSLTINPGPSAFALMRRTKVKLLAMPYLSWAWRADTPKSGAHPVRLIIGLADPAHPPPRKWWQVAPPREVKVTRLITVVWDENALTRGSIEGPFAAGEHVQRADYVARGGPEQGGQWWVDTIDLAQIHRQVWPKDARTSMEVRYIGFAAKPSDVQAPMHLATVRLTR